MDGPTIRLRLRVGPRSSRPGIVGRHGEAWKVRVAAPPENGKANEALLDLLAGELDVPRRDLELVTGHGSRDKVVTLRGLSEAAADERLATASERAR